MKEIELKILEVDKEAITKKLLSLGAEQGKRYFMSEEAFDYPDRRVKKRGELYRLRKVAGRVFLTHKDVRENNEGFSITEETEVEVDDYDKTKIILASLGLLPYRYRERYRTRFHLGDVHVELEEHPSIPPYIEIEGSKKDIADTLQKLGYTMKDTTDKTASDVLIGYGQDPYDQRFV